LGLLLTVRYNTTRPGQAPPHWASPALRDFAPIPLRAMSSTALPSGVPLLFRTASSTTLHPTLHSVPDIALPLGGRPLEPAALRSALGTSSPMLVWWLGERWRSLISRSGTGLRATRSALTLVRWAIVRLGCSRPSALSLPLGARPREPAALTLRSRFTVPDDSLFS